MRNLSAFRVIVVSLICSVAFLNHTAIAQVLFGSLVGSVTDASGAGVPGAVVKITEAQTNDTRTAQTNDSGTYTISTVPAGHYQVEITKEGFRGFVTSNIEVNQNNVVRIDAQLQVGSQTEKVEVSAEAALLQTDRADIHAEVTTQALESLPQATRSYEGLFSLVPGTSPPNGQLAGGTNNPSKSMQFSFNGTGTNGAQVRVEGVSANNPWQYYNTSYVPSIEAISERQRRHQRERRRTGAWRAALRSTSCLKAGPMRSTAPPLAITSTASLRQTISSLRREPSLRHLTTTTMAAAWAGISSATSSFISGVTKAISPTGRIPAFSRCRLSNSSREISRLRPLLSTIPPPVTPTVRAGRLFREISFRPAGSIQLSPRSFR